MVVRRTRRPNGPLVVSTTRAFQMKPFKHAIECAPLIVAKQSSLAGYFEIKLELSVSELDNMESKLQHQVEKGYFVALAHHNQQQTNKLASKENKQTNKQMSRLNEANIGRFPPCSLT